MYPNYTQVELLGKPTRSVIKFVFCRASIIFLHFCTSIFISHSTSLKLQNISTTEKKKKKE